MCRIICTLQTLAKCCFRLELLFFFFLNGYFIRNCNMPVTILTAYIVFELQCFLTKMMMSYMRRQKNIWMVHKLLPRNHYRVSVAGQHVPGLLLIHKQFLFQQLSLSCLQKINVEFLAVGALMVMQSLKLWIFCAEL